MDMEDAVFTQLQSRKGFGNYFADVIHARDAVDPPVMKHVRRVRDLSLTLNTDEYDIVGGSDIDQFKFTLAFGLDGLVDVADCFAEAFDIRTPKEESEITYNAIRFAILFQSAQVFTNSRLKSDGDFLKRFKAAMPQNRSSDVPYERMAVIYPAGGEKLRSDTALHYRVCRLAARIAVDRITTSPYGKLLRESPYNGRDAILESMKSRLVAEVEAGDIRLEDMQGGVSGNSLFFMALHRMSVSDSYPLMWAALANPSEEGMTGEIALAHIGERSKVRPGWIDLGSVLDSK